MDLIILAIIAAFIVYRLYATLGEKTGYTPDKTKPTGKVVDFPSTKDAPAVPEKADLELIPTHLRPGVQALTKVDPEFSLVSFQEGATIAFEMILDAFAKGDRKTLGNLISPQILQPFLAAIDEREALAQTLENTLVRVEEITIERIDVTEKTVQIKVHYVTEQVPILKDANGEIIDGNPNQIDQVIDEWTFERVLKAKDPNWLLVSTTA